ncbi:BppU family phage baseplate upper protein [Clostridium perfringens]|nr:BppU family phage baseplate upper protein [Clostridium perfringens]
MSEIGLNINVDSYNNEGIKTIKGNNNAEIYKLYILKNKRRLSLVGKNVKLGYVMAGTTKGDVIENLNITNAEQGEITFPITNRISKQDGVYSCQLAIYGADGFLEHTATFGLTVEANIFTKIAGEIADSKDFTYLENILDKASKLSEKLKENTSTATNANSNLESNITEANNINSKLLENTSTATSLNKNLESNIDLAKEVKETIKDLDTKNTEATSNIGQLTDLNNKAEELSNNIQQALPINTELKENIKIGQPLVQEATTKNTELQASLEKAKEFIDGLDGSQNIPGIRMELTELQNGLKSNQVLSYEGSSIVANETLEGRTEGMKVKGKTMYKKADGTYTDTWEEGVTLESFGEAEGNKISILSNGKNLYKGDNIIMYKQEEKWRVVYIDTPNFEIGKFYKLSYSCNETAELKIILTYANGHEGYISSLDSIHIESGKGNVVKVRLYIEDSVFQTNKKFVFSNIQIEEGTQSTPYEPYKENKKDILIKEPLRENDIMYEDNGQVKINRNVKQFTITDAFNDIKALPSNEKFITFQILLSDMLADNSYSNLDVARNSMCSNFKWIKRAWDLTDVDSKDLEGYSVSNINGSFYIKILKSKLTTPDVNGFKAWLKDNPTEIIYQLATPVVEVVDRVIDIDLDTYQEKTYFSIENLLPGTLDFKVSSNIASIVQNTAREVNNIWDVINNLLIPSLIDINKNVAMSTIKNNLK